MSLTQEEFDYIIGLDKYFTEEDGIKLAGNWSRDIHAPETKDTFILDYYRGKIELKKFTYKKRYKKTIVLLRFDASGRHTNPDGERFEGAHVHLYKEGYDDKFAYPISKIGIDSNNLKSDEVLKRLLAYCHIGNCPEIQLSFLGG